MNTGEILKKLMERKLVNGKPITPNRLARETKIPQSTMWRILEGETVDVKTRLLEKLAAYFGTTVAALRAGKLPPASSGPEPTGVAVPAPDHDRSGARQLTYVTLNEMDLLTAYRSSNDVGRLAIYAAVISLATQCPAPPPNVHNINRD